MKAFISAIREVIRITPVWFFIAHQDIVARYRRTTFGPWWITLGTGCALTGMAVVWSTIFQMELQKLFPYIAAGFVIWLFISAILTEGAGIFCSARGIVKTIKIPLITFIFSSILTNLYILLHNSVIIVIVFLLFRIPISFNTLLAIPGLLILIITAIPVSLILAIAGARFRDLGHIIGSLMTFLFLLTPIMWDISILKGKAIYLAYFNPITYYLMIIRDPLLNRIPDVMFYYGAFSVSSLLMIIAAYMYSKFENRMIYWI